MNFCKFRPVFQLSRFKILTLTSLKISIISHSQSVTRQFHISRTNYRMSKPTMEGVRLRWNDITVDRIKNSVDELISKNKKIYDKVGSVSAENASFETVIKPLIDCDREYAVERNNLDFVQHVFPDKKLRDVSVEADKTLSEFDVEGLDGLTPEQKRYVERQIKIGKRNVGVPETFIKSLEKTADDKCKLSLKYPHYFPCMKKCRNPKTRQKLENAFNSRCMTENTKILEELVKLRHEKAQILGFETHAEFVLDMRMAKNPDKVKSFLSDLAKKLEPLKKKDLEKFLKFKKHECEEFKYENDGTINMWDYRYYMTMVEEKEYAVDQNVLKEYFPLDAVTRGLLDIYQKLLGLKFEKIMSPEVWHPGVTMPGCVAADGSTRQVSVAAMVANFTEPQVGGEDSLLTHDEVETFFHEFGHVMHQICAQTETAFFSGTHVERDFVEAPSQMLENWCWEEKPLRHMSRHFKDGSAIPKEILDKLIASRKANAGVFNLRQILLGTFDQTIHTMAEADTAKLFSKLSEELLGFKSTPGTNMPASFGHLAGGYDAQYYGYMWSEVYCMDMFEEHFSKGRVMDPEAGAAYRKCILQPGGSKDAFDMLRDFLGREPKQDAFLRSKGLEVDSNL
ncbi:THOP1-like protein [Mya arenaria]|uniref:THOP1-like protein n=1 Tax=Mya arenaria TaxID=6604 RepID=A0ABY7FQR5_MYAAR|nr:THOP1-like protein [Mya arenaria]